MFVVYKGARIGLRRRGSQKRSDPNECECVANDRGELRMRGPVSTTRTTYTETLGKEEDYTDLTRVGVQVSVVRRSVMHARERPCGGASAKVLVRAGHRRDAERSVDFS